MHKMKKRNLTRATALLLALILALTPILSFGITASAEEEAYLPETVTVEDVLDIIQPDIPTDETTEIPILASSALDEISVSSLPISDKSWAVNITKGENGAIVADVETATAGTVVTLTAQPDDNCGLAVGTIKVVTDSQGATRVVRGSGTADDPFWFTMPDDSVTITSEFVRYRDIVIAEGIENGKIVVSAENNMAIKNEIITITLVPDDGYRQKFNSATNNANKSLTFTDMDGGEIRYNEKDWNSGIWEYSPTGTYQWPMYDDGRLVGEQTLNLNMAADTYYLKMPDCDILLNVEFAKKFAVNVETENGTFGFVERGRTEASVGERVDWVTAVPAPGYQLVPGSITVTNDTTEESLAYNASYTEFMMPESDVTVRAEFEPLPPPPVLEVQPFTAVAGDTEIVFTWTVHAQWASYYINYRPKGSEGAFTSKNAYTGGTAIGAPYTSTVSGLENDVEYEIYLSYSTAETPLIYAMPTGVPLTSVTMFNREITIPVGQTANMYATVEPAESKSRKLIWTSSDESVAIVDANSGKITAVSIGTATITSTAVANTALTDTCVVTVAETVDKYGGSMIIGSVSDIPYDNDGATVEVPFTVTVPINRPIFKANFDFAMTAANGRIVDISIDGKSLKEEDATNVNRAVTIGDSKINVGSLPKVTGASSQWGVIQPADGYKFLEPGKEYNFTLTVEILGTAPPIVPINFSNMGNYRDTFYYYDYDNSPAGNLYSPATTVSAGTVRLEWKGDGIPTSGSGTALTYNIFTANDLIWFADELAKGSDKVIVNQATGATARIALFDDIDLTGTDFAGIGTEEHPFNAFFLGQNYTVTYDRTVETDGAVGFINYLSGGYISGVTTKGSITVTDGNVSVGGLVGKVSGAGYVQSNCVNYVDISVTGDAGGYVGGFIGYAETTATSNVVGSGKNYGTIIATGKNVIAVGGHIGAYVNSNGNIGGDSGGNWGNITGRGFVGGIAGLAQYAESTNNKGIWENKNYGTVTGLSGEATGGIVGKVVHAHIGASYAGASSSAGNKNYGDVIGNTQYTGGIAGYVDNHVSEWNAHNYNEGAVTGELDELSYVGGIIGYLTGSSTINVSNNISKGVLSGENAVIGGVVAAVATKLEPNLCIGNYYAEADGLSDAIGAEASAQNFLSSQGWSPNYTDKGRGEDGSKENPYLIADAYDLLWFTNQVNDQSGGLPDTSPGKNYNVKLTANIDLTKYPTYQGIGTVTGSYPLQTWSGTFDGDGFEITVALDGNAPGAVSGDVALFRNISNATIKNVIVKGSVKSRTTGGNAAGLALRCDGTVFENVTNYADVIAVGDAAGVANGRPSSLYEVYNYGKIIGGNAAGLVNDIYGGGGAFIRNCANYGEILGVSRAAGIVSVISGGNKSADRLPSCFVENVTNNGNVTQTGAAVKDAVAWYNASDWTSSHFAAGIIGKVEGVIIDIRNVTNNGTIVGSGNNVGGIIGVINHTGGGGNADNFTDTDVRINNAVNNGNVASSYNGDDPLWLEQISVGGIVGNTAGDFGNTGLGENGYHPGQTENLVIRDSVNNGDVSGPDGANVGAIVGLTSNTDSGKVIIDNNFNGGAVDGGGGSKWGDQFVDGTAYDPETHEIIGGELIARDSDDGSLVPDNSGNTDVPTQPTQPMQPTPPAQPNIPENSSVPQAPSNPEIPAQPQNPAAPQNPNASTPLVNENNVSQTTEVEIEEANEVPLAQFTPSGSSTNTVDPIVLEIDDENPPLADAVPKDEGETPPDEQQSPQEEDTSNVPAPLVSDIDIDPTRINPVFIIAPIAIVIVGIGAIGFIRFRKKSRV